MNSRELDNIFDEAYERVNQGEDPEICIMRWPQHAPELRKMLATSQYIRACADDYDDVLLSLDRDVDWAKLLSNVPQDDVYTGNVPVPPVCPAVRQMVVANALSSAKHEAPPARGMHKRQQTR